MPTTESSNNPHVRITREDHYNLRCLSVLTGLSQGDLVGTLVTAALEELGNPHLKLNLPPRQRRREEVAVVMPVPTLPAPRPRRVVTKDAPVAQRAAEPVLPSARRGRPKVVALEQPQEPPRRGRKATAPTAPPPAVRRSNQRQPASAAR